MPESTLHTKICQFKTPLYSHDKCCAVSIKAYNLFNKEAILIIWY
jgi:hypothetical protein